jgi:Terminase small subunit
MTNDVIKAPARPAWAAKLNDQERLFVEAYVSCLNETQAALAAGFTKSSAKITAYRLRRKPHVADAIAKAFAERNGPTKLRAIGEMSRLAFSNVADVLEVRDGALLPDVSFTERVIECMPTLFNEATQYYSCFIGYSTKDQPFADRIHADL